MVIKNKWVTVLKPALLCFAGFVYLTAAGQDLVSIQYTDYKATSITIDSPCAQKKIEVRLKNSSLKILGDIEIRSGNIFFKPSFPFSSNLVYEVFCGNDLITSFTPEKANSERPYVVSVFPVQDTMPENLLKMHIVFSQPMVTGRSYPHIRIKENGKVVKPFLELESELWNADQTVFTLWLDPGRIKRDLRPNQLYGNPLTKGKKYELEVDALWKDQKGQALKGKFTKIFVAGTRDENLPSPERWSTHASTNKITVEFNEPLDLLLINHSFTLWKNEELIPIQTKPISNVGVELIPNKKIVPGVYTIKIDPKLEDLAGNNLLRPFDRDVLQAAPLTPLTEILFTVQGDNQ